MQASLQPARHGAHRARQQATLGGHTLAFALVTAAVIVAAAVTLLVRHSGVDTTSSVPGGGGHALAPAVVRSSNGPSPAASTAPSTDRPTSVARGAPSSHASASTSPARSADRRRTRPSVTYVVHRGDTLSGIADWFHEHGYGDLYERNRAVIGSDPDLIHPGQRITISGASGRMTVSH